jgi:predicted anti-sigma-YlaC factor YlaD
MKCAWVETELSKLIDGQDHEITCEKVTAHLRMCHSCRRAALDVLMVHRQIQSVRRSLPAEAFDALIRFLVWTGEPITRVRHD